jgi:predicted Fe-S protein YdhL (DUF1289 family)
MAEPPSQPVSSPCIKVCTLDANDVCQGCYRTLEEITAWSRLDVAGQRAVLERCRARARRVASG